MEILDNNYSYISMKRNSTTEINCVTTAFTITCTTYTGVRLPKKKKRKGKHTYKALLENCTLKQNTKYD